MRRLHYPLALAALLLAACFDFDSGGVQGDHHQYIVDHVVIPDGDAAVVSLGFDLEGDGSGSDNAFGGALNTLPGVSSFFQSAFESALAEGKFLLLTDLQTTSLSNATKVGINVYLGADPSQPPCQDASDTICGRHLDGATSFTISPTSPIDTLLDGEIRDGHLVAGPGSIAIEMRLVPFLPALRFDLVGARVEGDVSEGKLVSGKLGGGIAQRQILTVLIPGVSAVIDTVIATDCQGIAPDCCTPGTPGAALAAALDTNRNCVVDPLELTIQVAPLFALDVDLLDASGNFDPGNDGAHDALSFGMGFSAVGASFTRP